MNRSASWAMMFFMAGVAAPARSADGGIAALEGCFNAARVADAICSNPENPPQQRLDCFQKAQAAQLECLEHLQPGVTGSAKPAEPPGADASQAPANQQEIVVAPAQEPKQATPPPITAPPPEASPAAVAPATAAPAAVAPAAIAPVAPVVTTSPKMPDQTAGTSAKRSNADWIVSETTSPIDYSPLVVATIKSSADGKDAPGALSLRCRQQRTEITLRTDGTWRVAQTGKIQVSFQVNDKSSSSAWNLSADGKTATSMDHAAELIQSLPDGAALKVNVSDGVDHAATFQLTGLDAVRKRISAACRSTPGSDGKTLPGKR